VKRAIVSFLIALFIYLLLIVVVAYFFIYFSHHKENVSKKPERIKIALKDYIPQKAKKSGIKKKVASIAKAMPKGKQLKKIVKPTKKVVKVKHEVKKRVQPQAKEKKVLTKIIKPKLHPSKKIVPSKPTKPKSKLYSFLSKKVSPQKNLSHNSTRRENRINSDIKELYGSDFGKLSAGEQKYILDNQEIMRRITQEVLTRVGSVNIPQNLRVNKYNLIEFYLYPNGDISDIKFLKKTGFYILDDTTKETIEYAYAKYPRPKQKTLIRYKVGYYLRGF